MGIGSSTIKKQLADSRLLYMWCIIASNYFIMYITVYYDGVNGSRVPCVNGLRCQGLYFTNSLSALVLYVHAYLYVCTYACSYVDMYISIISKYTCRYVLNYQDIINIEPFKNI